MSAGQCVPFALCGAMLPWVCAVGRASADASLCLTVQQECELPGIPVMLALVVESQPNPVYGSQFTITYDPAKLQFVEMSPGRSCDPASPFAVSLYQQIDQADGELFFAVGVEPGADVDTDPQTVACLTMVPRMLGATQVCVVNRTSPGETLLADGAGEPIVIVNDDACPPTGNPAAIACADVEVTSSCECTFGGDECETLDAACRRASCDEARGVCTVQSVNEGGGCDDDNACTTTDVCLQGQCQGSGCADPSLCLTQQSCIGAGQMMVVAVTLGESERHVVGGQFSIKYDPSGLELVEMVPGAQCSEASPFAIASGQQADPSKGTVSVAVAAPPSAPPAVGPTPMACAYFQVLDYSKTEVCTFNGAYPFVTELVDAFGQPVGIYNIDACPAAKPFPYTSCVAYQFCEIPAVSEWGLVVLFLAVAIVSKVYMSVPSRRRRSPSYFN